MQVILKYAAVFIFFVSLLTRTVKNHYYGRILFFQESRDESLCYWHLCKNCIYAQHSPQCRPFLSCSQNNFTKGNSWRNRLIRFYCDTIIRRCSLGTAFFFCPESFSRRKKSGHSSVTYASEPVSVFCISVILFDYKNVIQLYVQPAWIRYYKYVWFVAGK